MTRAILLAAGADGLLTLMDAIIKEMTPRYHTFQIAFLRFFAGSILTAAVCLVLRPGWPRAKPSPPTPRVPCWSW